MEQFVVVVIGALVAILLTSAGDNPNQRHPRR
jgi:hypothetical protein